MEHSMRCAVVDDEPLALGLLKSYVEKTPELTLAGEYSSAVEAIGGLQREPVDLLFLDIQMPDLSGLEFSKMIDVARTRVVFTTAFSQYALEGYKVNALDYLLKPISYADFVGAVSRAQKWFEGMQAAASAAPRATDDYMFVKSDYKYVRIDFKDILYIEGLKDYVKIYLESQPRAILSLTSMRGIEAVLPSGTFFRIHRSYIVNMGRVSLLERGQIAIGERRLPISDSYKEQVMQYVNRHLLHGR